MLARRLVAPALIMGVAGMCTALAHAEEADPPLTRSPLPYRGRVVELLTDTPLEGALVVFVWPRESIDDRGVKHTSFAVRETTTDASGMFEIGAADIEPTAPSDTRAPRMLVWKPGYVSLPREYGPSFGVPVAWLPLRGGVLALKPVNGFQERMMAFTVAFASVDKRQTSARMEELPLFLQLARDEVAFFTRHSAEAEEELRKSP